jgi:hypothetical protein
MGATLPIIWVGGGREHLVLVVNPLRTAGYEKILQPGRQGFLNARIVTTQPFIYMVFVLQEVQIMSTRCQKKAG